MTKEPRLSLNEYYSTSFDKFSVITIIEQNNSQYGSQNDILYSTNFIIEIIDDDEMQAILDISTSINQFSFELHEVIKWFTKKRKYKSIEIIDSVGIII